MAKKFLANAILGSSAVSKEAMNATEAGGALAGTGLGITGGGTGGYLAGGLTGMVGGGALGLLLAVLNKRVSTEEGLAGGMLAGGGLGAAAGTLGGAFLGGRAGYKAGKKLGTALSEDEAEKESSADFWQKVRVKALEKTATPIMEMSPLGILARTLAAPTAVGAGIGGSKALIAGEDKKEALKSVLKGTGGGLGTGAGLVAGTVASAPLISRLIDSFGMFGNVRPKKALAYALAALTVQTGGAVGGGILGHRLTKKAVDRK